MSMSYEGIPRIIWGCGDGRYGDKDAKKKASEIIAKEKFVFVDEARIREYNKKYGTNVIKGGEDTIYSFGYPGKAVPSEVALKMLEDYNLGHFDEFMLRDIHKRRPENYRISDKNGTHLILDFNGSIYSKGNRTDHCYD